MIKPKNFVLDVDGVMTTGQFLYSENGKMYKVFGSHDHDGLKLLKKSINIFFITADKKGFPISKKRIVDDMGYNLNLVSEEDRFDYCNKNFDLKSSIYMGDGLHDADLIDECLFGIAPKNARYEAKEVANFVTPSNAGEGAVLDACLKIKDIFFSK
tara:strand:+ start:83 stop:550 length:468 start_codon:yes stop_codon:yes gene_type:complete